MKEHFLKGLLLPKFIKIFAQNAIKNCPYFSHPPGYEMPVSIYRSKKQVTVLQKAFFAPCTSRNVLLLGALFFLIGWGRACGQSHPHHITGSVISAADGKPLEGATIKIKQGGRGVLTGKDGSFSLVTPIIKGTLTVTNIGYKSIEVLFNIESQNDLVIRLEPDDNSLDEVQVIGYGQVSKRFNTGSVVTLTAQEIERQPISNPLAALAGRVPGMTVEQSNGNAGAPFNIQIRGQNSISQGSTPLILIDGIPYPNNQLPSGLASLANDGQSPMSNINVLNIQSIEILKDGDATAIYGSRGANGVVLITTKKGSKGISKADVSVYQGAAHVSRKLELLNTAQYVEMRKEAFANDGIEPTAINAPDLLLWDTTRYTDWQEYLIGGTAHYTNANASLSGGNANTQFMVSGNYNRQSSVFPGDFANALGSAHLNLLHASLNNRFTASITSNYSSDKNELPSNDLTREILLPPNNPPLFDKNGNLSWQENGGTFSNPLTYIKRKANSTTDNFLGNVRLEYHILKDFSIRLTGGYNLIQFNQINTRPNSSQDPNSSITAASSFAETTNKSWILEPQMEYKSAGTKGKLDILLGATLQSDDINTHLIEASGFASDAVIEAIAFANTVTGETTETEYHYQAVFGRVNYIYDGKYLLNITGRRDGSSRFGPDKRVANFGAIGAGWIFSEERWLKHHSDWLSFGKLRTSFGVTGNDQIGDYQYLDNYRSSSSPYQGQIGYIPSRLYNGDYTWERNRKLEAALEIGLFNNNILLTGNWFRNRSNSQLINYRLPDQVGFPSILRNYGALVQNTGWEFMISATPVNKKGFSWSPSANITINRNKLLEFPGLETSSYANTLVIGRPLNIVKLIEFTGVDPEKGIYTFNGTPSSADDRTIIADFTPAFYGGVSNDFVFGNWNFSFLFQFVKQEGYNYLLPFGSGTAPGTRRNQPMEVMERWQQNVNDRDVQRFTTTGAALTAYNNYVNYSDASVSDASFIRLKNLYLSYSLPNYISRSLGLNKTRLYVQGQNLVTISGYKGLDPETGRSGGMNLPTLAVYTLGIQLSL